MPLRDSTNFFTHGAYGSAAMAAQVFLTAEAEMLDDWKLQEWLSLFDVNASYLVTTSEVCSSFMSMPLIKDDYARLRERVSHLLTGRAWAERPRSRTRRLVTNVRVRAEGECLAVRSNFVIYQFRHGESWEFVGTSNYLLKYIGNEPEWPIVLKRCIYLDHETMFTQRRISIIV